MQSGLLFNGATYVAIVGRDKRAALESRMKAHVIACIELLCESPSVRERHSLMNDSGKAELTRLGSSSSRWATKRSR